RQRPRNGVRVRLARNLQDFNHAPPTSGFCPTGTGPRARLQSPLVSAYPFDRLVANSCRAPGRNQIRRYAAPTDSLRAVRRFSWSYQDRRNFVLERPAVRWGSLAGVALSGILLAA